MDETTRPVTVVEARAIMEQCAELSAEMVVQSMFPEFEKILKRIDRLGNKVDRIAATMDGINENLRRMNTSLETSYAQQTIGISRFESLRSVQFRAHVDHQRRRRNPGMPAWSHA